MNKSIIIKIILYLMNIYMFYLVDKNKKIIFGWSHMQGALHVKNLFGYLQGYTNSDNIYELPTDIENYTSICFVRDPYHRLIEGFLDKYNVNGGSRKSWGQESVTFADFINELVNHNWSKIDPNHFVPQSLEQFQYISPLFDYEDSMQKNESRIRKSKKLYIYDIKKINYKKIEELYETDIPKCILEYGNIKMKKKRPKMYKDVYNMDIESYIKYDVDIENFYDIDIKEKILDFYKSDFYLYLRCNKLAT